MLMKQTLIFILCLALTLASASAQNDGKRFQAYPMTGGDPATMTEVARSIVGTNGTVMYDRALGKLLVFATPSAHVTLGDLMKSANVQPVNVMLDVTFVESGQSSRTDAGVNVQGRITLSDGKSDVQATMTPHAGFQNTITDSNTKQMLMLRSGGEASLAVVQEVPFVEPIIVLGRNWGIIQPEIQFRNVGATLQAKATVIGSGPMIQVTLTPEISGLVGDQRQTIRYTKAATQVALADGQTVQIGSFGQYNELYDLFFAGFRKDKNVSRTTITLTARISAVTPPK
jgi:type II secretory pathway component GspD/PulD (secretin)